MMELQDEPEMEPQNLEEENDLQVTNPKRNSAAKILDSDSEVDDVASNTTNQEDTQEPSKPSDDEENDLNVINTSRRKNRQIVDSDSESDEPKKSNPDRNEDVGDESEPNDQGDKCALDTEDQEQDVRSSADATEIKSKKHKRIAIVDSDSEDETPITPHNKSFNEDLDLPSANESASIYNINARGELVAESNADIIKHSKSRLSALCDSESSEEEKEYNGYEETENEPILPSKGTKRNSRAPRTKAAKEPKEKKMTAKQAKQQRQEIRSESQRMLRESRLSLPYHKPKTHSIKEFLQNRPRLSLLKTINTPPSLAMKMSTEQLQLVTKKLKEREKVVEKFYKSESESDEEKVDNKKTEAVVEKPIDEREVSEHENPKDDSKILEGNQEEEIHNDDTEDKTIESPSEGTEAMDTMIQPLNTTDTYTQVNVTDNVEPPVEPVDQEMPQADSNQEQEPVEEETSEPICTSSMMEEEPIQKQKDQNESSAMEKNNSETEEIIQNQTEQNESSAVEENRSENEEKRQDSENEEQQEKIQDQTEQNKAAAMDVSSENEKTQENKEQNTFSEDSNHSMEYDFNLDGLEDFMENSTEPPEQTEDLAENITETNKETASHSVEYDFNLDDVEDFTENTESMAKNESNIEEEHLQRLLKKYDVIDTPDYNDRIQGKKLNKLDLLKQLGTVKPRLSGGPDEEIDLDEGTSRQSGVAQLMERFIKHSAKKNTTRDKIKLDIINLTQGEIHKETVSVSAEPEEEPVVVYEKPGVKLQKLRNELQTQMAQRRSELWQQKHNLNADRNKEIDEDEKSDCGADEDFLDDEEEAELTEGETTDEEDLLGDDDEEMEESEKPTAQSGFLDNEAEESEADECDEVQNDASDEDNGEDQEEQDVTDVDTELSEPGIKKPLKRILKGFTEDSDDEEEENDQPAVTKANISTASTDTCEDDEIPPPNQPRPDKTPRREMTQSKADLGFLTPVMHLTGLQGLNSGSKFLHESPVSPFTVPPDPSPFKDKISPLQKKLFADSDSEANMEDIADLCSGKFPSCTEDNPNSSKTSDNEALQATTQDLMSICSGSFTGITINKSPRTEKSPVLSEAETVKSNTGTETFRSMSNRELISIDLNTRPEIKDLDDDDRLISQLLDEEEMEQFKKKFDSPVVPNLSKNLNISDEQEVQGGGILFDSDDENEDSTNKKNAKKLNKKLTFSDDESDSEHEGENDDEEIDLHDDDTNADKIVDYDSEENEIEFDDEEEAIPQKKLKPSDFLENEAELSESDWDSADEDEKGLDALETEQGDADVFDENKMRTDLEKIHMRRVLDQDNQEIKILQELLLEDGELHGTGRQRQFRWKNIDNAENEGTGVNDAEVEAYLDEEESEEQWRRARHQREMFLKSKQEKQILVETDDVITIDSDSQVIKMGHEVVRKSLTTIVTPTEKVKAVGPTAPTVKKPLMFVNTRGSFLARDDKFLNRLAEFTKVTNPVAPGAPKNSKKFVFQSITSDGNANETSSNNKRKAADGTPTVIKKLRLSSGTSPLVKNANSKKQLF